MGILNCTPDSFYDGGIYFDYKEAIKKGLGLQQDGADIIDIGGESSRPGAEPVSDEEELRRVLPVIEELSQRCSALISIDTRKPSVAKAALKAGAHWINDIQGGADPLMRELVAQTNAPFCLMHMQGNPKNMQENPHYSHIIDDLRNFFEKRIGQLITSGVRSSQIIIDPGIGFGKTVDQNLAILNNLSKLKELGFPLLIGTSRKSFLSRILNKPPRDVLAGTLSINTLIYPHVDYFRVHDVKEHRQMIDFLTYPAVLQKDCSGRLF